MTKEMELKIEEILEKNYYRKDEAGTYVVDISADYRDKLEKNSLVKISNSDNATESFYEQFDLDNFSDSEEEYVVNLLKKELENEFDDVDFNELYDWVRENMTFNFPFDHYLKQTVCVNITVATGEEDVDYTLNNFFEDSSNKRWGISDKSSLYWLAKTQGYGKRAIKRALKNGFSNDVKKGVSDEQKFLYSVYVEINNTTTHMNQVVYFAEMSLGEFINLREEPQDIKLSKNIRCGLVDFWSGAGSVLDLKLEKSLVIPAKLLTVHIDGGVGYEVANIYGLCNSFWKANQFSIVKEPK